MCVESLETYMKLLGLRNFPLDNIVKKVFFTVNQKKYFYIYCVA